MTRSYPSDVVDIMKHETPPGAYGGSLTNFDAKLVQRASCCFFSTFRSALQPLVYCAMPANEESFMRPRDRGLWHSDWLLQQISNDAHSDSHRLSFSVAGQVLVNSNIY
jgi:hypothetical protein